MTRLDLCHYAGQAFLPHTHQKGPSLEDFGSGNFGSWDFAFDLRIPWRQWCSSVTFQFWCRAVFAKMFNIWGRSNFQQGIDLSFQLCTDCTDELKVFFWDLIYDYVIWYDMIHDIMIHKFHKVYGILSMTLIDNRLNWSPIEFHSSLTFLSTISNCWVGDDVPGILRDDLELNLREVDDEVDEANVQEDICPVCATTSSTPHPFKQKCCVAFPKRGRDEFCNLVYVLIHGERVWSDSCLRLVGCELEIWG